MYVVIALCRMMAMPTGVRINDEAASRRVDWGRLASSSPALNHRRAARRILTLGLALAGVALGSCSAEKKVWPPVPVANAELMMAKPAVVGGTVNEKTLTVTGTVQDIDSETHELMLLGTDGTEFTIGLAPDMEEVDEFEQGDQLNLMYRESIDFQVRKPDQAKPGVAHTTDVTPAPHGGKPGGSVTYTVHIRAPIAAIDKAASEVTVRYPRGAIAVVKVPDPRALDAVAVGDVMDIAYTASRAITVRKPAP